MAQLTRRDLLRTAAAALGTLALPARGADPRPRARVLVVGGGFGGTIAARYLRAGDPRLEITLIERDGQFVSCPMSNEVLAGERDLASLRFGYRRLAESGIRVIQDQILAIDAQRHTVQGASGKTYPYDKLVVAPGIDLAYDQVQGYSAAVAERIPHAWQAGPQTLLLRKQLTAMRDGGVCYIVAPPNPYRCPPAPYERAAQIARYCQRHKPRSKVIILDAKEKFSKQALFTQGYEQLYGGMVEWVAGSAGGLIEAIRPDTRTLVGRAQEYRGDLINLIPRQRAGRLAQTAGLMDETGWCPVDQGTFASQRLKDVHVIGDACIAGAMPKSGYAANSQAKVCAAAILAALNGQEAAEPSYLNTCYSLLGPDWGISVAAVYRLREGKIVDIEGSGGVSPLDAGPRTRALEARYARGWFKNITTEMFG